MRASLTGVLAGCACLLLAEPASALQGTIIWKNQECAYFILQTPKGYSLIEWVAGATLQDGDVIDGDMNAPGTLQLYNKTADMPVTVYVAARAPKKNEVEKDIPPRCR